VSRAITNIILVGDRVVAGTKGGHIIVWYVGVKRAVQNVAAFSSADITSMDMIAHSEPELNTEGFLVAGTHRGDLKVFIVWQGGGIKYHSAISGAHSESVLCITSNSSPHKHVGVSLSSDGVISTWCPTSGSILSRATLQTSANLRSAIINFDPDSAYCGFVLCGGDTMQAFNPSGALSDTNLSSPQLLWQSDNHGQITCIKADWEANVAISCSWYELMLF
jgi:hypothetical protein